MIQIFVLTAVVVGPLTYLFTPFRTLSGRILSAIVAVLAACILEILIVIILLSIYPVH
jgi:hypothetical protein